MAGIGAGLGWLQALRLVGAAAAADRKSKLAGSSKDGAGIGGGDM
jgi:hypothetical protein